jgi:phosphoribosylaminoimidazole carboxylase (NCAIR synthetase)
MVVRGASGGTRAYPAVETIHRESVCHIVYAPLRPPTGPEYGVGTKQRGLDVNAHKSVNERAQEDAQKAIDALGEGAVGVFGVEMFLMADGECCETLSSAARADSSRFVVRITPSQRDRSSTAQLWTLHD